MSFFTGEVGWKSKENLIEPKATVMTQTTIDQDVKKCSAQRTA